MALKSAEYRFRFPVIKSVLHRGRTYLSQLSEFPAPPHKATPNYDAWFKERFGKGRIMYAFATYEAAREKADTFNAMHVNSPYRGVVLKSFGRLYEEACAHLGIVELTLEDALRLGHPSQFAAIRALQPRVVDFMRDYHADLWRETPHGSIRVIFTVHAVAHDWVENTNTRLMSSRMFWRVPEGESIGQYKVRMEECRRRTALNLLVHDEVAVADLVTQQPAETILWVYDLMEAYPDAWKSTGSLIDRLDSYEIQKLTHPVDVSFSTVCDIANVKEWEYVTTSDSGEYGERSETNDHEDIYTRVLGRPWGVSVTKWPTQTAHKTIVLTTEAVPTAIARKIGEPWQVFDLDTPLIAKDRVETRPGKTVTSKNAMTIVEDERAAFVATTGRDLKVVGNKIKALTETATHHAAKGSNLYVGKDMMQTMFMMPPGLFEQMEALNAWCGRDDLIRLRHIDEFNQTAGRNLGFRRAANRASGEMAKHILLINAKLMDHLRPLLHHCRYTMDELVNRGLQAKAKAKVAVPGAPLTRMEIMRAELIRRQSKTYGASPLKVSIIITKEEPTPTVVPSNKMTPREIFKEKMDAFAAKGGQL